MKVKLIFTASEHCQVSKPNRGRLLYYGSILNRRFMG